MTSLSKRGENSQVEKASIFMLGNLPLRPSPSYLNKAEEEGLCVGPRSVCRAVSTGVMKSC